MSKLKETFKKYLLVRYAKNRLNSSKYLLSKSIPWIQRKSLMNTIDTHCKVLINTLLQQEGEQCFRRNKFILDSIFKYTLDKSANLIKTSKQAKDIKSYMQLNSFIVYDEIKKGMEQNKSKKAITYNIEKHLAEVQERIDSKDSINKILDETISA